MWADRCGWELWRDSVPVAYSVSPNEGVGRAESQANIFLPVCTLLKQMFETAFQVAQIYTVHLSRLEC